MQKLPKPILGDVTALTITTADLEKSLAFYNKLGFSLVMRDNWPFPWIQVSDGVLLIMLRKDPNPYLALTYYCDADATAALLKKKGITFEQSPKKGDQLRRYLIKSPDGLNISLVGITQGFSQPPGPGMLQMKPEDYFKPEKYVNKTAGLFGELAHPVKDLEKSIKFWGKLGFVAVSKFTSPYPWAILSDGLAVVGLHQTTSFTEPAITYFASDMSGKIAVLKKAGLRALKEKDPNNAVLATPEQQHLFLYQLGDAQPAGKKKKEIKAPTLETERLILREINPGIADELFSTCSNEEIISFMGLRDKDDLALERMKWEKGNTTWRMTYKRFVMVDKKTGKAVGGCALHNWYPEHRRAELGYSISDEASKNKGYMTEAVKAITTFGFDKMDLNRVEAFTSPDNLPSNKLLSGLGFVVEGTMRSHYFKEGKMHDSVVFRLLRDEYKKVKKRWK